LCHRRRDCARSRRATRAMVEKFGSAIEKDPATRAGSVHHVNVPCIVTVIVASSLKDCLMDSSRHL
jgi:hypothetical protein